MDKFKTKLADDLFQVRKLDRYMEKHNGFIAGGCFKNIFKKQAFKDVDIFFENEKDFNQAVKVFRDNEFFMVYENTNSICFSKKDSNVKVDLVRSRFGSPEDIIDQFDFTIAKFAYFKDESEDSVTYTCMYHPEFFEHLTTSKLVIDNEMPFPIGTFERSYRYMRYGFGLCRESKAKLIDALQGASTENLSRDLYFGMD